jgi:hypothetical protein
MAFNTLFPKDAGIAFARPPPPNKKNLKANCADRSINNNNPSSLIIIIQKNELMKGPN